MENMETESSLTIQLHYLKVNSEFLLRKVNGEWFSVKNKLTSEAD